ncbi:hypothetical protein XTPLMG730_1337 [Xanthomonas translucens pv. phlei]|uniref:Uncharacterized protein n=1 Tax=Xanthomonas graminis pv. phlei TaxID=487906 RepID=A0A0K2ZPC4_9XANT|nr:hypothetical protein XTPLMG730_1337 [Xanthomonas translucens pv. phlei]
MGPPRPPAVATVSLLGPCAGLRAGVAGTFRDPPMTSMIRTAPLTGALWLAFAACAHAAAADAAADTASAATPRDFERLQVASA